MSPDSVVVCDSDVIFEPPSDVELPGVVELDGSVVVL